ncbi:prepilin-type N-terminal cleavage/methylation domain-containing protein [Desulfoluna butyratoxydans]|uniref:Prokaryotic n-terminal methylation site n=1 Tax=Desulfoluna butyratoxydans TaxID=231438 RepID=A0A4U8YRJ9_9BACT|nr:prepilin-type N-terminal cleavage/methylation domain-containing protein [Desulfoluna butyratoxydans]VFQ46354.1 prokaryotic n-terminal methylation site [Desulfoluna butyratoxydans]
MRTVFDRRRALQDPRGFTLLEVMVSVSILAIGFFAIYSLFMQAVAASGEARFRQQAAFLATLKENTLVGDVSEISTDGGDFGEDYPGWRWRLTPSKVENKEFEEEAKLLKKVRLEVFREGSDRVYGTTHYLFVTEES